MIYLDYSATTPVNPEVLDTYVKVTKEYIGNANSLHTLGMQARHLELASTHQIATLLEVKDSEIIYTSGASEANNMVIKGLMAYKHRGHHIITTKLEHASLLEPLAKLAKAGFKVSYVKLLKDGTVDLDDLKRLLNDDTILVSIASVSSELGIRQPIEAIGKIIKNYPKCLFHSDFTQSIGKVKISLQDVDLATMSAHKFYGPKGIGILIKKDGIALEPLIDGGKSTTIYRSGTPALPLIAATAKALRLALVDLDTRYQYVASLNLLIQSALSKEADVHINSTERSIPHILNFSLTKIKAETMLHALDSEGIYLSTKSACATETMSEAVYAVTNDSKLSTSSLRISLSYLTTKDEVNTFLKVFALKKQALTLK